MGIPNRQIGWSQEANLLYEVSKQLDRLTKQFCECPTTTTTTTLSPLPPDDYITFEGETDYLTFENETEYITFEGE